MRVFASVSVLALLLSVGSAVATSTPSADARLLVGFDPKDEDAALAAIEAAGGEVKRVSRDLGFAVVKAPVGVLDALPNVSPAIDYVETDGLTRLHGAQWNGAQWNGVASDGAQWNGAQWNGAQWNGAQWNGAQWNGAQWNAVQWDAYNWSNASASRNTPDPMPMPWEQADPGLLWQWGVWETGTVKAWQVTKGVKSASVCVLDSGVAWDHKDIAPNYQAGYNAIDPSGSAYDDGGHGTHIAGIAAGAVGNAYGVAGVGNVGILNAKVLGGDGTGHESDLAFGIAWCARQDAEVAVMALSASEPGPSLDRALAFASDRDVLLVASAGNTGKAVQYPASDPRVVAVAATDAWGKPASFSSRGPQVELAAPGVKILSAFNDGFFAFGSGTSQAVAFVAGAAGLVRDHDAGLTASQTRERLQQSAIDVGPTGRDEGTGHGVLRTEKALR